MTKPGADARPIILIDFDGTIHHNAEGYKDGSIYGDIVPGFFDWFFKIRETYRPVIFSTRCADIHQQTAMADWLNAQYDRWNETQGLSEEQRPTIEYTAVKIPSEHFIDDRAIRFQGDWDDPALLPDVLDNTHPWNRHDLST